MIKVLKARYKFYLGAFAFGFLVVIIPYGHWLLSIYMGVFMALLVGNGLYYKLIEKNDSITTNFRILKYVGLIIVLGFIVGPFL